MSSIKSNFIIVIFFLIAVIPFQGCCIEKGPYQETRILMGTYVTIKVQDIDKTQLSQKEAVNKAFEEIKRIEEKLSSFKEGNGIDRINKSGTNEVFLDEDTFYVLERAKYFYEISGGTFDITVLPLSELWGFHSKNYYVPKEERIASARSRVGSDKIIFDKDKKSIRLLEEGMKIDLGGIAKGYAVYMTIRVLRKNGIKNALVDAGGDISCIGRRSEGKKWSVGIRNPVRKNEVIKKVELENSAIATSGGYENFFVAGGKKYIHIINPKTGYPVENNLVSVTIIAKDCLTADALATAVVVLGKEKGLKLINSLRDAEAIIVTKENEKLRIDRVR